MDHQGSPRKAKLLTVHLPSLVPTQSIQRCSLRLTDSLMIRQHGVTDEGQQGAFRERAGETGAGVLPMPRGQNGRDHTHTHTLIREVDCVHGQSCLALCNPMDYIPPGSSVHGIFLAKNTGVGCHFLLQGILKDRTRVSCVSCIAGRFFFT